MRLMQSSDLLQDDGFVIYNTQKFNQNIMKWAILCVNTWDCLAPNNDNITEEDCDLDEFEDDKTAKHKCHHRTRSLFSILVMNYYRNPGIVELDKKVRFVSIKN